MFKLRDYQQAAVDYTMDYFYKYKSEAGNPLILLPTGTGKSLVIAGLIKHVQDNWGGCRMAVLTHVKELVMQNYDKMLKLWPDCPAGIYSAGVGRKDKYSMVTFGGIQSIGRAVEYFLDLELIIVDECDLISPNQQTAYQKFFDEIKKHNPHLKIIGLTATGWRLGFGSIVKDEFESRAMFDAITFNACTPESFNWFINEGYLLPVVPKATERELDVRNVKVSGGEYVAKELQKAVSNPELTMLLVEDAITQMRVSNRHSLLLFCSGVDHAHEVCEAVRECGVRCEVVSGETPSEERDRILEDFKNGILPAVANNNVLTTGFDHPGLDLMAILRPSKSSRLWVQILGRGTRPCYADGFDLSTTEGRLAAISASHKQNCLVLDYSGNSRDLGPINDPKIPKRPGQKTGADAPMKKCEMCGTWNHASARYCGGAPAPNQWSGYCGNEFEFKKMLQQGASTKALIKNDLPVTQVFQVHGITYSANINRADRKKPATLKIDYDTGERTISVFMCLFHDGFAGAKARRWWQQATKEPLPANIDEALKLVKYLKIPTHINADISKKWVDILSYCYDGTAFNKQPASDYRPDISVDGGGAIMRNIQAFVNKFDQDDSPLHSTQNTFNVSAKEPPMDFDDDIPF